MANNSSKYKNTDPVDMTMSSGLNLSDEPSSIDTQELQEAYNFFYPNGKSDIESRFAIRAITRSPVGMGTISYIQPIADCPNMKWRIVGTATWREVGEEIQVVPGEYQIEFSGGEECTITDVFTLTVYNNGKLTFSIVPPEYVTSNGGLKYKMTDITIEDPNSPQSNGSYVPPEYLYQIQALKTFTLVTGEVVNAGDYGGYIKYASNLSQDGKCWIGIGSNARGESEVSEDAYVYGGAFVAYYAKVSGRAQIYGGASVEDSAQVFDDAKVYNGATVGGDAKVYEFAKVYNGARIFGSHSD